MSRLLPAPMRNQDRIELGDIVGCLFLFIGFIALTILADLTVDPDDLEDCAAFVAMDEEPVSPEHAFLRRR